MKIFSLLLFLLFIRSVAFAADLSGTIRDDKGRPIPEATVKIYTAKIRTGSSPYCPSCWLDCAKSARTGNDGTFVIKNVSNRLVFRLLVLAQGCEPMFIPDVDPAIGPIQRQMKTRNLAQFQDKQVITGTVRNADHNPVAGAMVEPGFSQTGLDPLAITDGDGYFKLTCPNDIRANYLTIHSAGHARARLQAVGGGPPLEITLTRGVTLSGRVTREDKPVANIEVGIVQTDRSLENFLGSDTVVTDVDGTFHIYNASPQTDLAIYGVMGSLAALGAIPVQIIHTGTDDSNQAIGDLKIVPSATLKGRLNETDGKPFLPETRINIGRETAWDSQIVDVQSDGSFTATGLPIGEKLSISAPTDHEILKAGNGFTLDPLNARVLGELSQVTSDLTVAIAYKPEAIQRIESETKFYRDQYSAFFKKENFTPGQEAQFIEAKRSARQVLISASKNGDASSDQKMKQSLHTLLVTDLGESVYQDYLTFEDYRNGLVIISWFYDPSKDNWLTDSERETLAPALGQADREFHEKMAPPPTIRHHDECLASTNQYVDEIGAAGNKVLPEAKHASFAHALAELKNGLIRLAPPN